MQLEKTAHAIIGSLSPFFEGTQPSECEAFLASNDFGRSKSLLRRNTRQRRSPRPSESKKCTRFFFNTNKLCKHHKHIRFALGLKIQETLRKLVAPRRVPLRSLSLFEEFLWKKRSLRLLQTKNLFPSNLL